MASQRRLKKHQTAIFLSALFGLGLMSSVTSYAQTEILNPHIRTLAASCAACHGTNGRAVNGGALLAGLDKTYFIAQMLAFKSGERKSTVMHHHAKGLNADEIETLATYFSAQTSSHSSVLQPIGKH
jgi:cytochrome c553